MRKFKKTMQKWEFVSLMAQIIKSATIGYKNEELELKLSDFVGWDSWFGFGEHDDGPQAIVCYIEETNDRGIKFLRENGFRG